MLKLPLFFLLSLCFTAVNGQELSKVSPFHTQLNRFDNLRDLCISSDGNEAYFTIQSPDGTISQIVCLKKKRDKWQDPELLHFNRPFMFLEPSLTPDNQRLYFVSDQPLPGGEKKKKDFDIWYVDREEDGEWSEPVNPGAPLNSEYDEFYPSVSKNGNLYFTAVKPDGLGKDDIYVSRWNGSSFESPEMLQAPVNSEGYEFNAFISPDEKFLLYSKYNAFDGFGSGDLYIVRRDDAGNWRAPENLGEPLNTKFMEYCPFYDAGTKTLYFTSRRSDLKPRDFKHVGELQAFIQNNPNGQSKLYKIQLDLDE